MLAELLVVVVSVKLMSIIKSHLKYDLMEILSRASVIFEQNWNEQIDDSCDILGHNLLFKGWLKISSLAPNRYIYYTKILHLLLLYSSLDPPQMVAKVEQSHQKQQNNHKKQVEKYVYHDDEGDTYERSVVDITAADSFNEHIADKENAFCAQFTQKWIVHIKVI